MSDIQEIANELHKRSYKVKTFRKILSNRINEIFSMDLVEMNDFLDENNGYKYILTCVDVYSRYAWAIAMKSKSGIETAKAIENIIKKASNPPEKIWTDEGKEFYNQNVDKLRSKYNIEIYSTYGVAKSSIVERFNRTFKGLMYKQFTINGDHVWYNILDELLDKYNKSKHSTIKRAPYNVYNNELEIEKNKIDDRPKTKPKFKLNEKIRISYKKDPFYKSYYPNWSHQVYIICEVLKTRPTTYKIKDESGEIIKGSFYQEELQKTKTDNIYLVEKLLQTRTKKGKKEYLVQWAGYPEKYNSWEPEKNIAHQLKDIDKLKK